MLTQFTAFRVFFKTKHKNVLLVTGGELACCHARPNPDVIVTSVKGCGQKTPLPAPTSWWCQGQARVHCTPLWRGCSDVRLVLDPFPASHLRGRERGRTQPKVIGYPPLTCDTRKGGMLSAVPLGDLCLLSLLGCAHPVTIMSVRWGPLWVQVSKQLHESDWVNTNSDWWTGFPDKTTAKPVIGVGLRASGAWNSQSFQNPLILETRWGVQALPEAPGGFNGCPVMHSELFTTPFKHYIRIFVS